MMLLTLFYILAGLCTGSFLALCADRLPRGESLFFPASHCDACGHRLGFFDLSRCGAIFASAAAAATV